MSSISQIQDDSETRASMFRNFDPRRKRSADNIVNIQNGALSANPPPPLFRRQPLRLKRSSEITTLQQLAENATVLRSYQQVINANLFAQTPIESRHDGKDLQAFLKFALRNDLQDDQCAFVKQCILNFLQSTNGFSLSGFLENFSPSHQENTPALCMHLQGRFSHWNREELDPFRFLVAKHFFKLTELFDDALERYQISEHQINIGKYFYNWIDALVKEAFKLSIFSSKTGGNAKDLRNLVTLQSTKKLPLLQIKVEILYMIKMFYSNLTPFPSVYHLAKNKIKLLLGLTLNKNDINEPVLSISNDTLHIVSQGVISLNQGVKSLTL